jgi:hypothetical protein
MTQITLRLEDVEYLEAEHPQIGRMHSEFSILSLHKQVGVIGMTRLYILKAAAAMSAMCVSGVFPFASSSATPAAPEAASAVLAGGAAILMGVAVAAPLQSDIEQSADREALRKRLKYLIENNVRSYSQIKYDETPRIVRVVFDVGSDGRAKNVRVGKRSGNSVADRYASLMVSSFKKLPGGERRRVCTILQYGPAGFDPNEPMFVKAMEAETDSAIADLRAGRDGPTYDHRGRVVA